MMYLLKVATAFSLLYGLYWIAYKNKTFHRANRFLLLGILLIPLFIPFLELPQNNTEVTQTQTVFEWHMDKYIEDFTDTSNQTTDTSLSGTQIITVFYLLGVLFFSIRFSVYLWKLIQIRRQSKAYKTNNQVLIYTKDNLPPFSFFNWIFLPEDEFSDVHHHPIIEHERAHVRQGHTFDLLFAELFSIFLWFVPFVYSFKNAMKSVHEYLADNETLKQEVSPVEYLKLLAHNTEKYTLIGLTHNFYCKTLKNRITMITKIKSSKISLWHYLLIIPALAFVTLACSSFEKPEILANNNESITPNLPQNNLATSNVIAFGLPIESSRFQVSSPFGMRIHPISKKRIMHNAIDLKAEKGTPVVAVEDGIVMEVEYHPKGRGRYILIQHANGFASLSAQLSEFKTELGATIKKGDIIGLVGSSGMSTGPHLHFELQKDGQYVDPGLYLPIKMKN